MYVDAAQSTEPQLITTTEQVTETEIAGDVDDDLEVAFEVEVDVDVEMDDALEENIHGTLPRFRYLTLITHVLVQMSQWRHPPPQT